MRIGVLAHVFYEDVWDELCGYLRPLAERADIYLTTPRSNPDLQRRLAADLPSARILPSANRGRDLGPLMDALHAIDLSAYGVLCKLHTKKGVTQPALWRRQMYEALIGSPERLQAIFAAFEADAALGLVGPSAYYLDGPTFIGGNRARLAPLASATFGPSQAAQTERTGWGFFAGSMFWFRPIVMKPLLKRHLVFEGDNGANDGQLAHTIERLIGFSAAAQGLSVGLTDPDDAQPGDAIVSVAAAGERTSTVELADYLSIVAHSAGAPRRARRRWAAPAQAHPGVTFIGPVEALHGLGVSARGYVDGLVATGLPLQVIPWRPGFDRVRQVEVRYPNADQQPINLVHLNLDLLFSANLLDVEPLDRIVAPNRFNIAIVYWELAAVPPVWHGVIDRFDEIWVASSFSRRAFQAITRAPVRVVRPVLHALNPKARPNRKMLKLPRDRFIFFYSADFGSTAARKNPIGYWRAYAEHFDEADRAVCLLKLHYAPTSDPLITELLSIANGRSDMIVMTKSLDVAENQTLMQSIDAYVSPHRAEGLGLTVLEAMQAAKPVIATRYGGVEDFVSPETAFVVDHRLVEVGAGAPPYPPTYVWAEPDRGSLGRQMQAVFHGREEAKAVAVEGQRLVGRLFSATACEEALREEVERIWSGRELV